MHILSLVLGIFGVVLIFVPVVNFVFSPMLSSAAIITGTLSRILLREKGKEEDRTIASAGLTLGIVGMGLCLLLYGSCAWLVEEVFEPKMKTWTAERDSDVIEKKMDRMEKKIESETKRLEDKLGKSIERIEKQLPPQAGTGREEQEEAEKAEKYIKDFMEKKRQMKEELKKWEQWLETMPILESKKGDEAPSPGAKPGAAKKPPPPAQPGEPAGAGTGAKPKPKKPKTGEAAGSKAPKIYKEIPAAKGKEVIKELISPYDYY
jgi:hypothetical protein